MRGSDVSSYYSQQAAQIGALIDKHRAVVEQIQDQDKLLQQELVAAQRGLAAVYLPSLSPTDLERVTKLTGFQGFARRDPRVAIEQERKVIAASITKIEADERFQRRDVLVGPAGTLSQELEQARDTLQSLQTACDPFESLEGFRELVEIGYDTPNFKEKWWHAGYWKHWAAGDRICKQLKMNDFGDDVLPAYLKTAEPRDFMAREVERINNQINAIHDLVRERDRLLDRQQNLEQIYLDEAQAFLGEHLASADVGLLEQWAQGTDLELSRAIQIGVRKIAGIQAKRSFLGDMANAGLPQMVAKLEERRNKAIQKRNKFSRPKHAYAFFADNTIDRRFEDKQRALSDQVDKLSTRVNKLVAARNYEGFDLRNDPQLWWLYFMHAAPPRYAPNLHSYYAQRPNASVITDPNYVDLDDGQDDAAARAFVAADQEQGGYLS